MKSVLKMMLMAIAMMAYCATGYAQGDKKERPSREQLAETQAKHIAQKMAMDDAVSQKFIQVYCEYQQELWALRPEGNKEKRANQESMTDAQAQQIIKDRFQHSQQVLNLREKYYATYSQFLSQKQILRIYEMEKQMTNRMTQKPNGNRNRDNRRGQQ